MKTLTTAAIEVSEAFLKLTKMLGESPDPAIRMEAAKYEIRFSKQLHRLGSKYKSKSAAATPEQTRASK